MKSVMICKGTPIDEDGPEGPEPYAELHFELETSRNGGYLVVKLTLVQVTLGIRNSCTRGCSARDQPCDSRCSSQFIHEITIRASLKSTSLYRCHRMSMEPQHPCQNFVEQRTNGRTLKLSFYCLKHSSFEFHRGGATSREVPAFGWEAFRDLMNNSVIWRWRILKLADGSEFRLNKARSGKLPPLPIVPTSLQLPPPPILATSFQMTKRIFQAEAVWEWEDPNEAMPVEVQVNVLIKTAQSQKKKTILQTLLRQNAFIGGVELPFKKLLTFQ